MPEDLELTIELVTEEDNENIVRPPSLEEIKDVIFSMNPLKALSLDSLLVLFY